MNADKQEQATLPELLEKVAGVDATADPAHWIALQLEIAGRYERLLDDRRQDNQWSAIRHYQAALDQLLEHQHPAWWKSTHLHLAMLYASLTPQRAQNIRQGIWHLEQLAAMESRDHDPVGWARTQHNLGESYRLLAAVDPTVALEPAVSHLENALEEFDRAGFPRDWGLAQHSLGAVYLDARLGDSEESLRRAIHHLNLAIQVRDPRKSPLHWAKTLQLLGIAHARLSPALPGEIERAIDYLEQCLEVFGQNVCEEAAATHKLLAELSTNRPDGDLVRNCRAAIRHSETAISLYEALGDQPTCAQLHLGASLAYLDASGLDAEDSAPALERVLQHAEAARQFYSRSEDRHAWATCALLSGIAYQDRPHTNEESDLENSLRCLQEARATLAAHPLEGWGGSIPWRLGQAHRRLVKSSQSPHLDQAIEAFKEALGFYSQPQDSAAIRMLHGALGDAYLVRSEGQTGDDMSEALKHLGLANPNPSDDSQVHALIQRGTAHLEQPIGVTADNIELAISCLTQALEALDRRQRPGSWAQAQNNLAKAYAQRLAGNHADNQQRAIECYQAALEVYTCDAHPADWAMVQNNLGGLYLHRVGGELAENVQQAVECFRNALRVYTPDQYQDDWAMTQHNLGAAYAQLAGRHPELASRAIEHFRVALHFRTRERLPHYWAMTQQNLGTAFLSRYRATGASSDLSQATTHLKLALEVYDRRRMPMWFADANYSLANAYAEQSKHAEAVASYQVAAEAYHAAGNRERWAATQYSLGREEAARWTEGESARSELAREYFQQALAAYDSTAYPALRLQTLIQLGRLYFAQDGWQLAEEAFGEAICLGDRLLNESYTPEGRISRVADTSLLSAFSAYCLLQLGKPNDALLRLEQGKTRILSDALSLDAVLVSETSPGCRDQLMAARQAVEQYEFELAIPPAAPARRRDAHILDDLRRARAGLKSVLDQFRSELPRGLSFRELVELVPPKGALVTPLVTSRGGAVLFLTEGQTAITDEGVLSLPALNTDWLQKLLTGGNEEGTELTAIGWIGAHEAARASQKTSDWNNAIQEACAQLGDVLMGPIAERLRQLGVSRQAEILLLAPGALALLPLHAAVIPDGAKPRPFLDEYCVCYAPSGYSAAISRQRVNQLTKDDCSLVAVSNPTGDLEYATLECAVVARHFASRQLVLERDEATLQRIIPELDRRTYVHFAGHAAYHWHQPLDSQLFLGGGTSLTLLQILRGLRLRSTRLIVLSACETGLADLSAAPNEFVGLPAGFLQAGAAEVVSSLWVVEDVSTMLLTEEFYRQHLVHRRSTARALQVAQQTVRDGEAGQFAARFRAELDRSDQERGYPYALASAAWRRFAAMPPHARPFHEPLYWAALTASGCPLIPSTSPKRCDDNTMRESC